MSNEKSVIEEKIQELLAKLDATLPKKKINGKYVIDFSEAKTIPALIGIVIYKSKMLLVKRSQKVSDFKDLWHVVAGHLDECVSIRQKMIEELAEEVNIQEDAIKSMHYLKPFEYKTNGSSKLWVVIPVVVTLKKEPLIQLDWENTDYAWITEKDLGNFKLVPGNQKLLTEIAREFIQK